MAAPPGLPRRYGQGTWLECSASAGQVLPALRCFRRVGGRSSAGSGAIPRSLTVTTIRAAGRRVLGDGMRSPLRLRLRDHRREPQEARWGGLSVLASPDMPTPCPSPSASGPTRGGPRGAPAPGAQAIREPIAICQVIRPAGGAGRPPPSGPRAHDRTTCPIHTGPSGSRGVKGGWHTGGPGTIPTPHLSTRLPAFARFRRMRTAEAACVPAVFSHPPTIPRQENHAGPIDRACARNGHRNLIVAECVYGRTLGELTRVRIRHRPHKVLGGRPIRTRVLGMGGG